MSCGVGRTHRSDPKLLGLQRRLVATVPIGPLAWEPPCVMGAALKIQNKTNLTAVARVDAEAGVQSLTQKLPHAEGTAIKEGRKEGRKRRRGRGREGGKKKRQAEIRSGLFCLLPH